MNENDISNPNPGDDPAALKAATLFKAEVLDLPTRLVGIPLLDGKLPNRVGRFAIRQLIGEGGMGVVGLGVETEGHAEKRKVAVKFLKRDIKGGSFEAHIFEQECKSLARFNHDNIARFIDFGYHDDNQRLPYIVMEYVEKAQRITDFCTGLGKEGDGKVRPLRERLGLFLRACEGIRHAHERNVIHRDISPKNVLVGKVDGKPVVKIIDFGISLHNEDKDLGETIAAGTPAYMSPEQLKGDPALVDQRSDVYSLGILLCELVVGMRPYNFETADEARTTLDAMGARGTTAVVPSRLAREITLAAEQSQSRTAQAGPGRSFWKELRGDVDAIVFKATALNPDERYSSVAQMIEDIENHLACKPLEHAINPTRAIRVAKWLKRNAFASAAVAVILLLLSGIVLRAAADYREIKGLLARLELTGGQLKESNATLSYNYSELCRAQQRSYASSLATFPILQRQGKQEEARSVLAAVEGYKDKSWEWYHLLGTSDQSDMVLGYSGTGFNLAKDAGPSICGVAGDHSVWFWQSKDGRFLKANVLHKAEVLDCAADVEYCYTVDATGRCAMWSATTGDFRREVKLAPGDPQHGEIALLAATIAPKGSSVAAVWREGDGARLGVFGLTDGSALCAPVVVAAGCILCWREDGTLQTADGREVDSDVPTTYRTWRVEGPSKPLSETGKFTPTADDSIRTELPVKMVSRRDHEFIQYSDGLQVARWKEGKLAGSELLSGKIESFAVSDTAEGGMLSLPGQGIYRFACVDGKISVTMDGQNGTIGQLNGHEGPILSLSHCRGDAARLISAGKDGTVRVWSPESAWESRMTSLRQTIVERWKRLPEAERERISGPLLNRIYKSATGWARTTVDGQGQGVLCVFDAPPWIMRSSCGDGRLESCAPLEGFTLPSFLASKGIATLEQAPKIVGADASLSGRFIVLTRQNKDTGEVDLVAGDLFTEGAPTWTSPSYPAASYFPLAVSEDGRWLVEQHVEKNSRTAEVSLWDFANGTEAPTKTVLAPASDSLGLVTALEFSPGGNWLAAGNSGGQLFLWKIAGDGCTPAPGTVSFKGSIRDIAFAHQEDKLAVALTDDKGNADTMEPRGLAFIRLDGSGFQGNVVVPSDAQSGKILVQDMAWNPAGTRLASADTDGTLRVWAFRRDAAQQYIEDCTLVLELDEAHWSEVASPLQSVSWSADGMWLVTSNRNEGCFQYHGDGSEEGSATNGRHRQVQLVVDEVIKSVPSVAQLKFASQDIPELKESTHNPAVLAAAVARVGVHPDEVSHWAWTTLLRWKQLPQVKLVDERKQERQRLLAALTPSGQGKPDAFRQVCIALAHYRLNQFGQARTALAALGGAEGSARSAMDALLCLQEGNAEKARQLYDTRTRLEEDDDEALPLWTELRDVLTHTSASPSVLLVAPR